MKITKDMLFVKGQTYDESYIITKYFRASREKDENLSGYMFFDTDKDFISFCIDVKSVDDEGYHPYRQEYLDALDNHTKFVIKDERSLIFERGYLAYDGTLRVVEGLLGYINDCIQL